MTLVIIEEASTKGAYNTWTNIFFDSLETIARISGITVKKKSLDRAQCTADIKKVVCHTIHAQQVVAHLFAVHLPRQDDEANGQILDCGGINRVN